MIGSIEETTQALRGGVCPKHVNIETVNFCNARCPFCPLFQGVNQLDRTLRPAEVMSPDLYLTIVQEIAGWAEKPTLTINMDGEPLMDPYFDERMRVLSEYGLAEQAHIQTNGQFLTESKALKILGGPLAEIHFSFDGATKETYEKHRVRCDFDRVLSNLKRFVQLRDELKASTRVYLKYTRTNENAHEVAEAYAIMNAFMHPEKDIFLDVISHSWGQKSLDGGTLYNPAKKKPSAFKRSGCNLANSIMVISTDGRAPACCLDYNFFLTPKTGFGNVKEQGVTGVWRSDGFETFRDDLANADTRDVPDLCKNCVNLYEPPDEFTPPVLLNEEIMLWKSPYNYAYRFTRPATDKGAPCGS